MEPVDTESVAKKIRSGEYFEEARAWYSYLYHSPIAERGLFLVSAGVSIFALFLATISIFTLMPLHEQVPFIMRSDDIGETVPHLNALKQEGENADQALVRTFITQYVKARETYDVDKLEANAKRVRGLSGREAYQVFVNQMSIQNPDSPINLYERHSSRAIEITGLNYQLEGDNSHAIVTFAATLIANAERRISHWKADLVFSYNPLKVDQDSGKVTPMQFLVNQYEVKQTDLE